MHHEPSNEDIPGVVDRDDGDRSLIGRIVPLLALAVMAVLVVQSCLAPTPPAPAAPRFDPARIEQAANTAALAALASLSTDAADEQVLAAINLAVINFTLGSSDLPPGAAPVLDAAARHLAALPAVVRVQVGGHTDNQGLAEANMALSIQRAEAVRGALIARKVPAERLSATGFGDSKPIASNATVEGRFRNRRIEFSAAP